MWQQSADLFMFTASKALADSPTEPGDVSKVPEGSGLGGLGGRCDWTVVVSVFKSLALCLGARCRDTLPLTSRWMLDMSNNGSVYMFVFEGGG